MTKPFNLERAIAGDPVQTRDGRLVVFGAYFEHHGGRIVGWIDGQCVSEWHANGTYYASGLTSSFDLVMAPKKQRREVWQNWYLSANGKPLADSARYNAQESATQRTDIASPPHAPLLSGRSREMPRKNWEMYCEHANECPAVCPCDDDCGCKEGMCRERPVVPYEEQPAPLMHALVPYEQSRAYWINVWAGQAMQALLAFRTKDYPLLGAAIDGRLAAETLADEIFGKEDEG